MTKEEKKIILEYILTLNEYGLTVKNVYDFIENLPAKAQHEEKAWCPHCGVMFLYISEHKES